MKKLVTLTAAVLISLLPGLQAQDSEEDAPNPDAPAAESAPAGGKDAKAKGGAKGAKAKAGAKDAKADAKDAKGEQAEAGKSEFSAQQQKIQVQMDKMKKAKRGSERRRVRDVLLREQRSLQYMVTRKLKPYEDQVSQLKERVRLSRKEYRAQLEKELADLEAKIETIKKDADLEKWCAKPDSITADAGSAPNPGPGKKIRRGKKKK